MGMDVYGKAPADEQGEYFRNNIWSWHPLAEYILASAPEALTEACSPDGWHSNSGDGLDAEQSIALAAWLAQELKLGNVMRYEAEYNAGMKAMPDEVCRTCKGTTVRMNTENNAVEACRQCDGNGTTRPLATWYTFESENVSEFTGFLMKCGGFEIH